MNAWALISTLITVASLARRASAQESVMPSRDVFSEGIRDFAVAIATAEGFYIRGTIPQRLNNPGDLKASSVPSIGKDAHGHLEFRSAADGWLALHRQLQLIVEGRSRVYTLDMTIAQMAARYAEGSAAWSANVTRVLGVPATTKLRALLT